MEFNMNPNNSKSKTPTILFTDDDCNIISGYKLALRSMRNHWNIEFASSHEQTIKILMDKHIDVIVCDLKIPNIGGLKILHDVAKTSPTTIRLILSGTIDQEQCLKSASVAHQFLSKPCPSDQIIATINKVLRFRYMNRNCELRDRIHQYSSLPVLKTTYDSIIRCADPKHGNLRALADIIHRDAGMSASVLRLVNSSFFCTKSHIKDIYHAITLIGTDTLKALAISANFFNFLRPKYIDDFSIYEKWDHSLRTSFYARDLSHISGFDPKICDNMLIAGLLHDIGKLTLAENMPEKYIQAIKDTTAGKYDAEHHSETAIFAVSHAEAGAYLLNIWGFEDEIIDSILLHHDLVGSNGITTQSILATANRLDYVWTDMHSENIQNNMSRQEYLEKLRQWCSEI